MPTSSASTQRPCASGEGRDSGPVALSSAARWEAYQASSVDCLAPYLDDAPLGARKYFRASTRREAALLRAGIPK
ncbi:MAG: hypothetical protein ABL955_02575 [Elusimicrobiota bacterium]